MGDFNVTFFVQIINFLIVWFFLDKFFFRPFVVQVQFDQQEKHDKQDMVIKQEALLKAIEKEQKMVIKETKLQFLKIVPQDIKKNSKIISADSFIHVQECDVSTRKIITHELVNDIIKRITCV